MSADMIDADAALREHEKWILSKCPNDLGNDHWWGWWPWEDAQSTHEDIAWAHYCISTTGRRFLSLGRIDIHSGTRHQIVQREPLTIVASVACASCHDHGFITEGRWVKA